MNCFVGLSNGFFDIFGAIKQRDGLIKKNLGKFHGSVCKNIWGGGHVDSI